MLSRSPRNAPVIVAALVLAATLAPSAAAAASWSAGGPPVQAAVPSAGFDLVGGIRHLLGRLWPQIGCVGDPSGGCLSRPSAPSAAGRMHPSIGCTGDPNGGSQCTSSAPQPRAPRS
jgi:hypothetical protein